MKRRILATALTLCLTLSLVPTAAFAAGDKTFDDVNGHWGQASVERWAGYGVLNGDNFGNFNPDKQMTRAEFATMLANMMGYTAKASSSFGDVASDAWYADAVLKLAAAGVMLGDNNGNANPNKPISRAEAAVMLCRAFNIQPSNSGLNFADSGDVADWAKGSMAALAEKGMMNGVGNNQLAPLANITRASVAKLVDNMVSEYVTESKEITGTVNGIVLVVGSAEVTVKDATLTENLIVAPKAEGAEVTLTGSTTASDVYVDAAASVKVDAQASAGEVQLSAPKASAEVAGKADTVTTTAAAAEATVTVAKDATVSKVEVAAPNTGVNVAGKVDNVNVASSATGTEVKTESGAAVSNVTTSANDVKVSGNGKVENVTANGGTADVTTPGTKVENKTDSADNVTANGKPVPPSGGGTTTPTKPGGSGGGGGGGGDRPSATTYTITVDSTVANGTIAANPTSAAEGATVTITGTPAAGYALKSVTVTRETAEPEPPAEGDGGDNADTPASQAEETNTVETTPAGDNKFTFTMPAGNVTVTGEFYQPLTNFQVLLINNTTEYAKLPTEFKTWDGSPNNAGWNNLAEYPWLAITGSITGTAIPSGGYTTDHPLTGTLNISFKSGSAAAKPIASPWTENQVIGKYGALTAYVKEPPAGNPNGDKLGVTEDFGDFTVTLTYKGATYTDTVSYIAKGADAYVVTFNSNAGSDVASQTVAKDGTVAKPGNPTRTGYTFVGWFKEENLTTAWNFDTDKVTAATTLYAKWTPEQYTVTFNVEGKTTTSEADYDAKITEPTPPTAENKYFVGWYKDAQFADKWDFENDTVAGNTTLYAKFLDVTPANATLRPAVGHATTGETTTDANFNYHTAYTAAGIELTEGTAPTIKVNQTTAKALIGSSDDTSAKQKYAITKMSGGEKADCFFVGIAVAAPEGAASMTVNGDPKDFPSADGTGSDVFVTGGKYYYISYYPAIKADGTACDAKTWDSEQLVWLDKDNNVIKVETLTVHRNAVTNPTTTPES